jgi:hypothetical protein
VLWKELLIFLIKAPKRSGHLRLLDEFEPLPFDPALACDYLACFGSDEKKRQVVDELESHYDELAADKKRRNDRLQLLSLVGNPSLVVDDEDDEDDEN